MTEPDAASRGQWRFFRRDVEKAFADDDGLLEAYLDALERRLFSEKRCDFCHQVDE